MLGGLCRPNAYGCINSFTHATLTAPDDAHASWGVLRSLSWRCPRPGSWPVLMIVWPVRWHGGLKGHRF